MVEHRNDERGLTLIEMMVALFVVSFVLMALASTLIGSLRAIQVSERVVDATQLGNEIVEELLTVPYERLYLYQTEAEEAFGALTFEGHPLHWMPDPSGTRDSLVPRPLRTLQSDGTEFEVRTAIAKLAVDGEPEAYRRIIVELTWQVRGEQQFARVEATRSSRPDERTLSVTVTPDLIRLSNSPEGRNIDPFRIDVYAEEPLSAVEANWKHRDGGDASPPGTFLPVAGTNNQHWRLNFSGGTGGRRFANGGTRFEIAATAVDGDRTVTTVGRATFLHTLGIDAGSRQVVPGVLQVHPTSGVCSGLYVSIEVIGAVLSDPMTIQFDLGDDAAKLPTAATESLVYGTRYEVAFDAADLPMDDLTQIDGVWYRVFELEVLRAADAQQAALRIQVPVVFLTEEDSCTS